LTITGNDYNNRVCNRANAKQVTPRTHLSKGVINLSNFFALPGIRTQTDHLQGKTRCPCVSSLFKIKSRKHQKLK